MEGEALGYPMKQMGLDGRIFSYYITLRVHTNIRTYMCVCMYVCFITLSVAEAKEK